MKKYQKIRNDIDIACDTAIDKTNQLKKNVDEVYQNTEEILEKYENIHIIISDIDKQFSEKTGITNKKDMTFLWSAVALQCARWIMLPMVDEKSLEFDRSERKNASLEGKKDKTQDGKKLDKLGFHDGLSKYPSPEEIMALPVPFDAMKGTEDIVIPGVTEYGKNLYGGNHHSATLGHDPILGYIFGTLNILTRSITFHRIDLLTKKVERTSGREQQIADVFYSFPIMLQESYEALSEDFRRLDAGLRKEYLHLKSDKYTKDGLPIPLLKAETQQKLLRMDWNSKEIESILRSSGQSVFLQWFVAHILNLITGTLHGFCYDEKIDESLATYSVRTKKVVIASNIIASTVNLATVAAGTISGVVSNSPKLIKKSITHLDIGGYVETLHQIINNRNLQEIIRREFLEQELYNQFAGNAYSFLEEAHYE